jgi:transcriptional regulator with XRE-family HTH domain
VTKTKVRKPTTDAVEILDRRYFAGRPRMRELLARERFHAAVAQQIYDLRVAAGLTQAHLARQVGTTASVICRLEDADYGGRSLTMLLRIADALGHHIEMRFVPGELEPTEVQFAPQDVVEDMVREGRAGRRPAGAAAEAVAESQARGRKRAGLRG